MAAVTNEVSKGPKFKICGCDFVTKTHTLWDKCSPYPVPDSDDWIGQCRRPSLCIQHSTAPNKTRNFHCQDNTSANRQFDWLNCTRYKPPKLPRQRKKEGVQRRSLGRSPRIPFSSSQVAFLEARFLRTPYLSSSDVSQLASYLKLSETKVKIWFQNRRAREKRERETKFKPQENCEKNERTTLPPPRPTAILPLTLSETLPLQTTTACKYITTSTTAAYLQIVAPLDLSERRLINRSK